MKISLNWLTDYVDVKGSAKELAAALARVGLGCEEIIETPADVILDLEVTSNRPDWLGHIGVAREVAAATGAAFHPPKIGKLKTSGKAADLTAVAVEAPDLCPRYTARVIRGVKVGPSPAWMVERLEAVGLRSINNVVDATNYVLMEYSQPLHSFDLDKLAERRIVVRRARPGEQMVSIDGTRCTLAETMLVIADAARPVAVAGIMGGANTEVSDATTDVLIESAHFDPLAVRRASRTLRLSSESNYRFERGIDPVGVDEASLRACQLILDTAGGKLAEGIVDVWAKPFVACQVALRPQRTDAVLGISIPPKRQAELLARLGLSPHMKDGRIVCTIPSWRADLTREIDLIEEVIRLAGYDKIPAYAQVTHDLAVDTRAERLRRQAAAAVRASGFDQTVTITFIEAAEAAMFCDRPAVCTDPIVRKTQNALRPTLLPSLLAVAKTNQDAGNAEVDLFEVAAVFPPGPDGRVQDEHEELAMVTTRDLAALRGALEAVVAELNPQARVEVQPAAVRGLDADASGRVRLNGQEIGAIGMVAANVLDHYGLAQPLAAAAVRYDALLAAAAETRTYQPVPRFPAVRRDLSLVVDEAVTWQTLADAVAAVPQPMRVAADYVTTYRGKPVPSGRKSVTIRLTYRDPAATLRSDQVDQQVAQLVDALKAALAAELRA